MNMVMIFVLSGALIAYAPDCVKRLNEFSEDVSTASLSVGTKIVLPDAENSGADSVDLIRDSLFSIQVKQPWLLLQFGDTDTDAVGEERIDNILSASPVKTMARIGKTQSRPRSRTTGIQTSRLRKR